MDDHIGVLHRCRERTLGRQPGLDGGIRACLQIGPQALEQRFIDVQDREFPEFGFLGESKGNRPPCAAGPQYQNVLAAQLHTAIGERLQRTGSIRAQSDQLVLFVNDRID